MYSWMIRSIAVARPRSSPSPQCCSSRFHYTWGGRWPPAKHDYRSALTKQHFILYNAMHTFGTWRTAGPLLWQEDCNGHAVSFVSAVPYRYPHGGHRRPQSSRVSVSRGTVGIGCHPRCSDETNKLRGRQAAAGVGKAGLICIEQD